MNKKLFNVIALMGVLSSFAVSNFDLSFRIGGSAYTFGKSISSVIENEKLELTQDGSTIKNPSVTRSYSAGTMFNNFAFEAILDYCVVEDVYLGLAIGGIYEMDFAKTADLTLSPATEDAEKVKKVADLAIPAAGIYLPISLNFKYDIVELMDDLHLGLFIRPGTHLALSEEAAKNYKSVMIGTGYTFQVGLCFDYMNIALDLGYKMFNSHGSYTTEATVEFEGKEAKVIPSNSYSSHGLQVSLGYNLRDLF